VDVNNLFRTEDLAVEAGDAMLAKLDHGQEITKPQAGDWIGFGCGLHMDDIGRADNVTNPATGAFLHFDLFDH
jgi:hypothetical protein